MTAQEVIQNNIETLQSATSLFSALSDEQYVHIHEPYFSASIGQHFRHILDHYFCFLAGLKTEHVDYDARQRDARIETRREYSLVKMQQIIEQLKGLKQSLSHASEKTNPALRISLSSSTNIRQSRQAGSSLIRELVFLQGHTTHHYALIRVQLKLIDYPVADDFGMAASTLIYKEYSSCAR